MYGHLPRLTAALAAALALLVPGAGVAAATARDGQEAPDQPPSDLEPTPAPSLPPDQPDAGASREPRDGTDGDAAREGGGEWRPDIVTPAPGDAPPAGPGPGAPAEEGAAPAKPKERGWIDSSHGYLESKLFAPVMRLDRFFSDETDLEAERARSFLRWRHEVRLEEDGVPRYATSVRANLRFPGVSRALRRLRLVIQGETSEAFSEVFPNEEGAPAAAPDVPVGSADAELRLKIWDGLLAHADLGAGVLLDFPPGAFGRLRLRWAIPLGERLLTRVALIGFYRTDERFGASVDLHLERPVTRGVLTRISTTARISQESPGVEWSEELATFVVFGPRSVGAVGVGVNGATEREPVRLERVRVFTRLRRDFYRHWLFFELQPEYFWPYTPALGRHAMWAVTTRIEIQFHGRARLPEPEDPEPADPPPPPYAGAGGVAPRGAPR